MPDHGHGYKPFSGAHGGPPVAGFVSKDGHSVDWGIFDRKVDLMTKDELRHALKKEARLRAAAEARRSEVI